jgi:WhiB family redox-sensing transcriptional regulator
MPPASPSTASHWRSADLVPSQTYNPSPEIHSFHWDFFPSWHEEAKCRTAEKPDEMFFGEHEDSKTTMTVKQLREIKAYCRSCPVWETCLRHSLSKPERHGIWAGTSKRTRLRILSLIDSGDTSINMVVEDYKAGREKRYESIRHPQ